MIRWDRCVVLSPEAGQGSISQPALAMGIRQLEQVLGVRIVQRNRRVLGLTQERGDPNRAERRGAQHLFCPVKGRGRVSAVTDG